jgi:hypothetical protein
MNPVVSRTSGICLLSKIPCTVHREFVGVDVNVNVSRSKPPSAPHTSYFHQCVQGMGWDGVIWPERGWMGALGLPVHIFMPVEVGNGFVHCIRSGTTGYGIWSCTCNVLEIDFSITLASALLRGHKIDFYYFNSACTRPLPHFLVTPFPRIAIYPLLVSHNHQRRLARGQNPHVLKGSSHILLWMAILR